MSDSNQSSKEELVSALSYLVKLGLTEEQANGVKEYLSSLKNKVLAEDINKASSGIVEKSFSSFNELVSEVANIINKNLGKEIQVLPLSDPRKREVGLSFIILENGKDDEEYVFTCSLIKMLKDELKSPLLNLYLSDEYSFCSLLIKKNEVAIKHRKEEETRSLALSCISNSVSYFDSIYEAFKVKFSEERITNMNITFLASMQEVISKISEELLSFDDNNGEALKNVDADELAKVFVKKNFCKEETSPVIEEYIRSQKELSELMVDNKSVGMVKRKHGNGQIKFVQETYQNVTSPWNGIPVTGLDADKFEGKLKEDFEIDNQDYAKILNSQREVVDAKANIPGRVKRKNDKDDQLV